VYAAAMAKLGIPETAFDTFEPWFAGVTLAQIELQKAGFNAAEGVEVALNAAATASGKPVSGLETLEQQLGYFHTLPQADQIAFLI
ncbi:TraB/GumN family protein, partial [Pseudomonas sp. MPR-R2A5]